MRAIEADSSLGSKIAIKRRPPCRSPQFTTPETGSAYNVLSGYNGLRCWAICSRPRWFSTYRLKFITSASRSQNILPIEVWKESSKAFRMVYIFSRNSSGRRSDPLLADHGQRKRSEMRSPKPGYWDYIIYFLEAACARHALRRHWSKVKREEWGQWC